MDTGLLELLKKAILSTGDEALLQQVRERANEIVEALEEDDVEFSDEDIKLLELHLEWTAAVFHALAGPQEVSDEDHEILEAIRQIRDSEDTEIGTAFAKTLIETLPPKFRQWDRWFDHVPLAPKDYQAHLGEQIIVMKGMPYAEGLVSYGMTPGTFFEGSRGVELLVDRLIRTAMGPEDRYPKEADLLQLHYRIREQRDSDKLPSVALVLRKEPVFKGKPPVVPYGLLLAQVRGTPYCPPEAAEPLLHWMVEVSQLRPYFFPGYYATTLGENEVRLTQDPRQKDTELEWRWGKHT